MPKEAMNGKETKNVMINDKTIHTHKGIVITSMIKIMNSE
jgi:hypothetical protein